MKEEYRPITIEDKLSYLIEECGEVISAVGKTLRFGLKAFNPEIPEEDIELNKDWILRELNG